jgi:hypothetical protein
MEHRRHRPFLRPMGERGGVVLDLVLAVAIVLLGAFLLDLLGVTLAQILGGAGHFFGF